MVAGEDHTLNNSKQSIVSGHTNKDNTGVNNAIFGQTQDVLRSENTITSGHNNIIVDASNSAISG